MSDSEPESLSSGRRATSRRERPLFPDSGIEMTRMAAELEDLQATLAHETRRREQELAELTRRSTSVLAADSSVHPDAMQRSRQWQIQDDISWGHGQRQGAMRTSMTRDTPTTTTSATRPEYRTVTRPELFEHRTDMLSDSRDATVIRHREVPPPPYTPVAEGAGRTATEAGARGGYESEPFLRRERVSLPSAFRAVGGDRRALTGADRDVGRGESRLAGNVRGSGRDLGGDTPLRWRRSALTEPWREAPTNRKPPTYDGKSSWSNFRVQFEIVAEMNDWSPRRCAMEMAASLRDQAVCVLSLLEPRQRNEYPALVQALEARFEPKHQTEMHRAALRNRTRKRGENLAALAQDVKSMTRKAFPTATGELWEQLTVNSFLDSLPDAEMEWAVLQGKPKTVEEAVTLAMQFEAFKLVKAKKQQREDLFMMEGKAEQNNAAGVKQLQRRCYYCQAPNHLIKNCEKRRKNMEAALKAKNRQEQSSVNNQSGNQ